MSNLPLREQRPDESGSDDQRHRFQRDRDRILYTRAFRRLSGVTQVARADETYTYHDRLSHSLKVAQIGRRLAERLQDRTSVEIHPDVVETAALAHDIGHPPFGHAIEQELDEIIRNTYNVEEGFEGNAQSFRAVTRLCINRGAGEGLNLTYASLNAILKYPWKRGRGENRWGVDESKKWEVYKPDLEVFRETRQLSSEEKRRGAEADIMDWADDLAYAVHDVEDFYRAGIIPLDQLLTEGSQESHEFVADWAAENDSVSEAEGKDILQYIGNLGFDSLKSPYKGTEVERKDLKSFSSKMIARYLGVSGGGVEIQDLNPNDHYLQLRDYLQNEVSLLKHMTKYYVIQDSSLSAQQRGQRKVIRELFTTIYNATLPEDREDAETIHIVPPRYLEQAKRVRVHGSKEKRVRFVADFITGLTERQATQLHKRLTGDTPGTLQNRILQ